MLALREVRRPAFQKSYWNSVAFFFRLQRFFGAFPDCRPNARQSETRCRRILSIRHTSHDHGAPQGHKEGPAAGEEQRGRTQCNKIGNAIIGTWKAAKKKPKLPNAQRPRPKRPEWTCWKQTFLTKVMKWYRKKRFALRIAKKSIASQERKAAAEKALTEETFEDLEEMLSIGFGRDIYIYACFLLLSSRIVIL